MLFAIPLLVESSSGQPTFLPLFTWMISAIRTPAVWKALPSVITFRANLLSEFTPFVIFSNPLDVDM